MPIDLHDSASENFALTPQALGSDYHSRLIV